MCVTTSVVPPLSGCSDPVSEATLEPTEVRVTRDNVWHTKFVTRFEVSALATSEGITGVTAYLLGSNGEVLHDEVLGSYVWSQLPAENRETVDEDVTFYKGSTEDEVTATTETFPFWVAFGYEGFRLTRSSPDIAAKAYAHRDGGAPESNVGPEDWETVSDDELPRF